MQGNFSIADLKHDRRNPRKHNPRNLKVIVDSLYDVGFARSIVIDENNEILAGNGVTEAAAIAGIEKVIEVEADGNTIIAVRRRGLTDEQKQRLKYFDNRSGELANWDAEQLFADLNAGVDLSALFHDDELDELLAGLQPEPEPVNDGGAQIDRAEELRAKWDVRPGQLWQLGEHRLICGDCTDAAVVARVMDNNRAAMCFTSPPYNAGVSAQLSGNTSIGDNLYKDQYDDDKTQGEYLGLLRGFTDIVLNACEYVFVNLQFLAGNKRAFVEYLHYYNDRLADIAIWDKVNAAPALAQRVMDSRFEFVIVFSQGATRAIGTREFRGMVHNVYTGKPQGNNEYADSHAATFPVDLPSHFIETFTNRNDVVLEPFSGSGTTIIACEQLGRKCRAVEISPSYCAVAIDRWATATSKTPQLAG